MTLIFVKSSNTCALEPCMKANTFATAVHSSNFEVLKVEHECVLSFNRHRRVLINTRRPSQTNVIVSTLAFNIYSPKGCQFLHITLQIVPLTPTCSSFTAGIRSTQLLQYTCFKNFRASSVIRKELSEVQHHI